MNTEFQIRIAQERAKLKLLLAKVDECKIRISALEVLSNSKNDAFDDALENSMLQNKKASTDAISEALTEATKRQLEVYAPLPQHAPQGAALGVAQNRAIYTRKDSIAPEILTFLESSRKNIDDVDIFVEKIFGKKSRGAVRNLLWNLKKQGLVSSPQTGSYVLTDAGRDFLELRRRDDRSDESAIS